MRVNIPTNILYQNATKTKQNILILLLGMNMVDHLSFMVM